MALTDEFQPEAIAKELTNQVVPQLTAAGLPPEETELSANMLFHFAKIAGEQILNESGLQIPGTESVVPYTTEIATQCVQLFFDGATHAMLKCSEYEIVGDQKTMLMQQLAMDLFNHTKQIVASTQGQEMTPDVQFSQEQQSTWIKQNAESSLMYYINELEQQKQAQEGEQMGVEAVSEEAPSPPSPTEQVAIEEQTAPLPTPTDTPHPPQEALPPHAAQPLPPQPISPQPRREGREKYAAVSLFLTALRASQKAAMLQQFSPEERQVIDYYQHHPEKIVEELHVGTVERHLREFHDKFKTASQEGHFRQDQVHYGLYKLIRRTPKRTLQRLYQPERSTIQTYLYTLGKEKRLTRSKGVTLPPKVEEVLFTYLKSRTKR